MRFFLRGIGILFTAGAITFVVAACAVGALLWKVSRDLPDYTQLADYQPAVMTRVHAADGSLLAEYARERRMFIPIQAVPKLVIAAFVSAEDKNFYKHQGVDPEGIARAALYYLKRDNGRRPQGASTITQQVAKNFLLTSEQTFDRKIKEVLLALRMEKAYTKDKILELYLNEIYLGLGNYGVAAASLNYYGKSVHELTLAEVAYLAALPKGPNNYNPFRAREAATERRNYVIDRMVENGYVSREDGEKSKAEPLTVNPRSLSPNTYAAGFFAEEVRRDIADRFGEKALYEGGLSVRTTLDPKMQVMARKALADGLVRYDEAHGWRGPMQKLDIAGKEWGAALAEAPALGDVQPWRLAVVLDVAGDGVRIGLQPAREPSGAVAKEREAGVIPAEGLKWTRKPARQVVSAGDVVYVEPLEGKPGQFRLRQLPEISGALVAMDPYTGRVLAMVGGFSFDQSKFNRATQAQRQPGSSFKPIVYAAAMDNGYTPSSIILDAPISIDQGPGQEPWRPENAEEGFAGPRTLRFGVEHSQNMMTVRLAQDIGMPLVVEYAKRFGVYDNLQPLLAMALGSGETTVMRMTAAYAMFANGGRKIHPTLVDRIQDRWGRNVYAHDERKCVGCDAQSYSGQNEPKIVDERQQVLDPLTAYQITSILEGVVQRGTGTVVKEVGKPLAGKTGTTNDAKDLWFVGFSPDLAAGVYIGYDQPRSLGNSAYAAQYAAPIFRDFMKMALADKPPTPFRVPPGIKLVRVDPQTGARATGGERTAILEAFKPGTAPPERGSFGDEGAPVAAAPQDGERQVGGGTGGLY
ncbi:penicillin-binding protein 1A [Alsobacter sp. SYSU BS001988]